MLKTSNLTYQIGTKSILNGITASFQPGECGIILGPNGSGKSSLLKLIAGQLKDFAGEVLYEGLNLSNIKLSRLARQRAVMSQQPALNFPLLTNEVVMMGRYPHFEFNPGKKDFAICKEVIERLSLQEFSGRNYLTLSGGEKQRVQFARVLAQIWEPPASGHRYLFLDEPVNNLDILYQHTFLQIAREMAGNNTVVIAVLHDINLAIQYGDQLIFMKDGRIVQSGLPALIVTPSLIREVFDVPVKLVPGFDGTPFVTYDQQVS